jgi:ABC-type enterobactin transport system permease subunit
MDERGRPRDRDDDSLQAHELSRRQRDAAVAGWSSFLIAAMGTMVLFAFVDPMTLVEVTEPPLPVDRMTGYAIGFFFLWVLTAASAALTLYLLRTSHAEPPPGN